MDMDMEMDMDMDEEPPTVTFTIIGNNEPEEFDGDESVGENKKAVALKLRFQSDSKTLEDKDVNSVINEIIRVVSKNFSAKLR